jgi:hypothetical protein
VRPLEYSLNKFIYSTDYGITWNEIAVDTITTFIFGLKFIQGNFYFSGFDGIFKTPDITNLSSYVKIYDSGGALNISDYYAFDNIVIVSLQNDSGIYISQNGGASYTFQPLVPSSNGFAVGYTNGVFVTVKKGFSTESWTALPNNIFNWISVGLPFNQYWASSQYDSGLFYVIGAYGHTISFDGSSWTYHSNTIAFQFNGCTILNGHIFSGRVDTTTHIFHHSPLGGVVNIPITDANFKSLKFNDGISKIFFVTRDTVFSTTMSILELIPNNPNIDIPADGNKLVRVK